MKATRRTLPTQRRINSHPAPALIEALAVTRFWRSVDVRGPDECWPWIGDTDRAGYGRFRYQGRMRQAHELALSFSTGEIRLPWLDTCHECDNPPCCNPADLRFDTRLSNVVDKIMRGRLPMGEDSSSARLTNDMVRAMRDRRANGARQKDLAVAYGISNAYVSDIVNGLTWQDAGGPITGRSKRTRRYPNSTRAKAN